MNKRIVQWPVEHKNKASPGGFLEIRMKLYISHFRQYCSPISTCCDVTFLYYLWFQIGSQLTINCSFELQNLPGLKLPGKVSTWGKLDMN